MCVCERERVCVFFLLFMDILRSSTVVLCVKAFGATGSFYRNNERVLLFCRCGGSALLFFSIFLKTCCL